MLEHATIRMLQAIPIGPDELDILQWVRTASSGRKSIVVICGASYFFLPDRFGIWSTAQNPTVILGTVYYFDCRYEIRTGRACQTFTVLPTHPGSASTGSSANCVSC